MVKMHVLATSLAPLGGIRGARARVGGQDGKLWNGTNGRSGELSHSNDVIGACICSNDVMCVALPIVGAWSMAVFLWQLFEYLLL